MSEFIGNTHFIPLGKAVRQAVERVYRLMAEGDVAAAMEELAAEFDLPPPAHECRVAAAIAGKKEPLC